MKHNSYYPVACSCIYCHCELTSATLPHHLHYHHQLLYPKPPSFKGKCKYCDLMIRGYSKKQFCNSSCAASYNNKQRSAESRSKQQQTLKDTLNKKPKILKIEPLKNELIKPKLQKLYSCIVCCQQHTKNTKTCSDRCLRAHLSNVANNRSKHFRPANRASIDYKGVKLGSPFELAVCMSLDQHNIKWVVPKGFTYFDNKGKSHKYYPDIFLPDYNLYLDPKNDYLINNPNPYHGYYDHEKIKWAENHNNIKVLILNKDQLSWEYIKSTM